MASQGSERNQIQRTGGNPVEKNQAVPNKTQREAITLSKLQPKAPISEPPKQNQ